MKKIILILFLLLILAISLQAYTIISIKGQKNIQKVISSKQVYIVFTAYKVLLWDESLEAWVKKEKASGKNKNIPTFTQMKKDMYAEFEQKAKSRGKKWGVKMLSSISKAKKGYVLHINVDKVEPTPPIVTTGKYTIRAYRAGSKSVLFTVKMKITQQAGLVGSLPRNCLKKTGEMLGEELWGFMRKGK